MINYTQSGVPSKRIELLRSFLGRRIVSAIRYSWWPAEESAKECGILDQDVFSLTAGAVTLGLDSGLVLAIANEPSAASVVIWLEKDAVGNILRDNSLKHDTELYPISADDFKFSNDFWRSIIGGEILTISIFRRYPKNVLFSELPNEACLCFTLTSGIKFFATHGLHNDSDDFSVLEEKYIAPSIRKNLKEDILNS